MSFDEAMELVSRDDAFKATIYAMNTLLIHRGIYAQDEFQNLFIEWVKKEDLHFQKRGEGPRKGSDGLGKQKARKLAPPGRRNRCGLEPYSFV